MTTDEAVLAAARGEEVAAKKIAEANASLPSTDDVAQETPNLLMLAERLWSELEKNDLGGYSGINRPFWILTYFKLIGDEQRQAGVREEQQIIADKAREYAMHYPIGSDGRNTFVLLAEWIDRRALAPRSEGEAE